MVRAPRTRAARRRNSGRVGKYRVRRDAAAGQPAKTGQYPSKEEGVGRRYFHRQTVFTPAVNCSQAPILASFCISAHSLRMDATRRWAAAALGRLDPSFVLRFVRD